MKYLGYALGAIGALFWDYGVLAAVLILVAACFGLDFKFGPTIILWVVLRTHQYVHKKESKK